jgi:HD-GYP domain-containing protein (c-di-GMP phosphodiesterase class II)
MPWQAILRGDPNAEHLPRAVQRRVRSLPSRARIDGSGHPNGKRGDEISIGAQIISVADAWTAMLSDRAYRTALSVADAREEMLRGAGSQFEGTIVAALLDVVDQPDRVRVRHHAAAVLSDVAPD